MAFYFKKMAKLALEEKKVLKNQISRDNYSNWDILIRRKTTQLGKREKLVVNLLLEIFLQKVL